MTNFKNAIPDGWYTQDLPGKAERHLMPNDEIKVGLHVASKLCFCQPIKSPPYDVTLYSHRNISRDDATNEVILKRWQKKNSERVVEEVKKEVNMTQKADSEVVAKMGLQTNDDVLKALRKLDETSEALRRYLAVNA